MTGGGRRYGRVGRCRAGHRRGCQTRKRRMGLSDEEEEDVGRRSLRGGHRRGRRSHTSRISHEDVLNKSRIEGQ
jgi:hypothetical protein